MPRNITKTVYTFAELSEDAKEAARAWYRDGALDYEWFDTVYEDAKELLKLIGFSVDKIYFSGFHSQGDGACFVGSWYAGNCDAGKLRAEIPASASEPNRVINSIADGLQEIANAHPDSNASIRHTGHYCHSHSVSIDTSGIEDDGDDEAFRELARDAMDWIYRNLEREYEWLMSDDQVDESIIANEYTFTKDGRREG